MRSVAVVPAVLALAMIGAPGGAWATNRNVPGTYPTIQAGVNAALPGDVVVVAPGLYPENVVVSTSLTLSGANAGVDGRGARGAESIIDGQGNSACIRIFASGVIVDGFTLRAGQDNGVNAGVWLDGGTSGTQILDNILTDNVMGVFAESSGPTLVRHNLFDANNRPGPNNGTGVYAEHSAGLTIEENEFRDHLNHAARFASGTTPTHAGLVFSCNSVHDNGNGVLAIGVSGGAVTRNDFVANTLTALSFGGGCSGITVSQNRVGGGARGVRVSDGGSGAGTNSAITVHDNRLAGSAQFGLGVIAAYSGTLDARGNWWGHATGPGPVGPGSGDDVVIGSGMSADFSAWRSNGVDADPGQCGFQPVEGGVTPLAPDSVICPLHPCLTVPVVIDRPFDPANMRGTSIEVQLTNLTLCGPGITEGGYLSSVGGTHFEVLDHGGGSYTVDDAILGSPCGAVGNGTLFYLHVAAASMASPGLIAVTAVIARDCGNGAVVAAPGPIAAITIDQAPPAPPTGLTAAQVKVVNLPPDGRTQILLTLTPPGGPHTLAVYRAPFGAYPEYDDGGGTPPAPPAYPPGPPWTLTSVTASGQTDKPPTRDVWYYVAFAVDSCLNGAASNMTPGTLDYHLGDVSDGFTAGAGDNTVNGLDISLLGASYGLSGPAVVPVNYLDVGPTMDLSTDARPTTDDVIGFEDLLMFALNYAPTVSAPRLAAVPAPVERNEVDLDAPVRVEAGAEYAVKVTMRGSGDLQAVSIRLTWDPEAVAIVATQPGAFLEGQGGVTLSPGAGALDGAVLGAKRVGIAGEGVLGTVRFRAVASGDPGIALARVEARDRSNRTVALGAPHAPEASPPAPPSVTELAPASPNPFGGSTTLAYALARGGPTTLAVYDVNGRLVRTLVREARDPGRYITRWDGTDDHGARVRAGIFFVRLEAGGRQLTRAIARLK